MITFILKKSGIDAVLSTILLSTMFEDIFTALTPIFVILFVLVGNLIIYILWVFIKVFLIKMAKKLPEPYQDDILSKIDKAHNTMQGKYYTSTKKREDD